MTLTKYSMSRSRDHHVGISRSSDNYLEILRKLSRDPEMIISRSWLPISRSWDKNFEKNVGCPNSATVNTAIFSILNDHSCSNLRSSLNYCALLDTGLDTSWSIIFVLNVPIHSYVEPVEPVTWGLTFEGFFLTWFILWGSRQATTCILTITSRHI